MDEKSFLVPKQKQQKQNLGTRKRGWSSELADNVSAGTGGQGVVDLD